MGITDDILALQNGGQQQQQPNWVQNLIDQRYQPKTERLKRTPVGFQFKRDPFDPSSYYNQLGTLRDISVAATNVVKQEVQNQQELDLERQRQEDQQRMQDVLGGMSPGSDNSSDYNGKSRHYTHLGKVSSNTAAAADYWGGKYNVGTVYGFGPGSVKGSDHPKGRALDFMMYKDKRKGDAMANDIIKHYKQWNVKYVIWYKYIWHPGRGWTRYSGPSDHTDHVHVSFNK